MADEKKPTGGETLLGCLIIIVGLVFLIGIVGFAIKSCSGNTDDNTVENTTQNQVTESTAPSNTVAKPTGPSPAVLAEAKKDDQDAVLAYGRTLATSMLACEQDFGAMRKVVDQTVAQQAQTYQLVVAARSAHDTCDSSATEVNKMKESYPDKNQFENLEEDYELVTDHCVSYLDARAKAADAIGKAVDDPTNANLQADVATNLQASQDRMPKCTSAFRSMENSVGAKFTEDDLSKPT